MATPEQGQKWQAVGIIAALGIIFGDIGTSPIYVLKALVGHYEYVSPALILGGLSCIFWTLILITTFKYVYLALKADNRGEGGIFALFARVRRYKAAWIIFPALVGCATLIADGFITPAISVSAAVEGMHRIYPTLDTVPFVMGILIAIFVAQALHLRVAAKWHGLVMFVWFCLIGFMGLVQIIQTPSVLEALNPMYALKFVFTYKGGTTGFWLLGAIFLCTTGAEALYSDLGRCGKWNIRMAWVFVLPALILSYFGQGAWLLQHYNGQKLPPSVFDVGIFYSMLPQSWVLPTVILAIFATVIVSQALISGVMTMVNEAIRLRLWFNMKTYYPAQSYGQAYIPVINWFLLAGCLLAVSVFHKSDRMEEAYGMAIVVDMLMTTALLVHFIHMRNRRLWQAVLLGLVFAPLELAFFTSNVGKITHGGWFTFISAIGIFFCVFVFWRARKIREKHSNFSETEPQIPIFQDLINDETVPKSATNLVYFVHSDNENYIDSNVLYSIFRKKPKRANFYWFVHIVQSDNPFQQKYKIATIIPGRVFYIRIKFGFKMVPKVNSILREIINTMEKNGEIDERSQHPSLRRYNLPADFRYIILNSRVSVDDEITPFEQFIVRAYRVLKRVSVSPAEGFGLDMTNVDVETVPIRVGKLKDFDMQRDV